MQQYTDLVKYILQNGKHQADRTKTGTLSVFGYLMRFDLAKGFPLLGTKFTPFKAIAAETIFFLRGYSNIEFLHRYNVHIWDEWADKDNSIGRAYGVQWRDWNGIDQIDQLLTNVALTKANPNHSAGRRLIVESWNVAELSKMALPPCHKSMQFNVANGLLSCKLELRSSDVFLGLPFNIASYALLTHLFAAITGLGVGELVISIGNAHLYSNHLDQVTQLLSRADTALPLPTLTIRPDINGDFDAVNTIAPDDFIITGYKHLGKIPAPVAV